MRKVLLPQRPALRALVILLALTAIAASVVLLGLFYLFTLPWRILRAKHAGRRGSRRSVLPQWIEALTSMVEAFSLAKMSTAGVKVTKSKAEPGIKRRLQGDLPDDY